MISLRNKIKGVVSNEKDLNKIMGFIFWEISKLDGKTDQSIANKVKILIKHLVNTKRL